MIDYAIKQWSQVSFMISSIEDTGLDGKIRSFGIILREMHCRLADNARRNNISHEHGAIGVPDSARVVIPLLSTKHFNNAKSEIKLLSAYYKKIPKKTTLKQKQYEKESKEALHFHQENIAKSLLEQKMMLQQGLDAMKEKYAEDRILRMKGSD